MSKTDKITTGLSVLALGAICAFTGSKLLDACAIDLSVLGIHWNGCPAPEVPPVPMYPGDFEREQARATQLAEEAERLRRQITMVPACPLPPSPPAIRPVQGVEQPPPQVQAQAPKCEIPRTERVVLVLDSSLSMNWSYELPPEMERRFDQLSRSQPFGGLQNRFGLGGRDSSNTLSVLQAEIEQYPGPSRFGMAKSALNQLLTDADPEITFEFQHFSTCGVSPKIVGHFPPNRRETLRRAITSVETTPETALGLAIRSLSSSVSRTDKPVNVVLVSDGADSCGNDPCQETTQLARTRPDIKISVVAVSKVIGSLRCISDKTGGKFYQSTSVAQLAQQIKAAAGQQSPNCR